MGRDVSNSMLTPIVELARTRGLPLQTLLEGLSISATDEPAKERIDWNDVRILFDRLYEQLGPEGLETFFHDVTLEHQMMGLLSRVFQSPRELYLFATEQFLRRVLNLVLGCRGTPLAGGKLRLDFILAEGLNTSVAWGHVLLGSFRAYPALFGLPAAEIEATLSPQRCSFIITPPFDGDRPLWPPSRGDAPSVTISLGELSVLLDLGLADAGLAKAVHTAGQRLATCADVEKLAADFMELMRHHHCCRHVVLWVLAADGERITFKQSALSGDNDVPLTRRPLTVGDREVGGIEVDLVLSRGRESFCELILPWLAIGVDRWVRGESTPSGGSAAERTRRLAALAQRWALTPRQRQALELLVAGCSNKEIGDALGVTLKTVEVHVGELLRKSGTPSRAMLISAFWSGT